MVLDYYQLREQPFGAACGPAQFYAGHAHAELIASFTGAILSDRGNLALVAEPGMGKTTLLCELFDRLLEAGREAYLFQKQCTSRDILHFLLSKLGIDATGMDPSAMRSKLNEVWFAEMLAGRRFVLLFDDANELDGEVFKTIGLLLKYETPNSKLLQIVLCAQPPLVEKLGREDLAEVRKRIGRVKHLEPLSPTETAGYVRHRLNAAGHRGQPIFEPEALALIAVQSQGIPRNINKICSRALLEAYARGLRVVSAEVVDKADRNLNVAALGDQTPMAVTSPRFSDTETFDAQAVRTVSRLTYRAPSKFGMPGSQLWATAIVVILLTAGLALPHGVLRKMTQMTELMHGPRIALTSPVRQAQAPGPLSNSVQPILESRAHPAVAAQHSLNTGMPRHEVAEPPSEARHVQEQQLSLTRELGLKINRIVIDPGHGGFDTGAKGPHGLLEKDLCLDVALRLGYLIKENISDAKVVYTRTDDSYVPLEERTAIANAADADLFISIHANSSDSRDVRGVETYYLSLATSKETKELAARENALTQSSLHDLPDLVKKITSNEKIAESKQLAVEIQDTLSRRLQLVSRREKDRGVKQAPFIVLTGANMPAVLTEISFVSNASDESLLLETGQRQRIAEGLYRGIAAYLEGLHDMPRNKPKLITQSHFHPLSGFGPPMVETPRNPL